MPMNELAAYFPDRLADEIIMRKESLTEIRMRINRPVQLVSCGRSEFIGERIPANVFRKLLLRMMDYSYYTREEELAQGFFTMKNGCRVGVCGSYVSLPDRVAVTSISSACIRVARALPGCAEELIGIAAENGNLKNTLILSLPGLGKTSMLRDAARILSEGGRTVGIADERHEIAACVNGAPSLDVGPCTDVVDGLAKPQAIERLIRSMSPQVIITDEIGSEEDAAALRETARKGIAVIASAHASSIDGFLRSSRGSLIEAGLFSTVILLSEAPGRIHEVRRFER